MVHVPCIQLVKPSPALNVLLCGAVALQPNQETIEAVLNDPQLLTAFDDPEVMTAVRNIAQHPEQASQYSNNEKVRFTNTSEVECVMSLAVSLPSNAHHQKSSSDAYHQSMSSNWSDR